jgi:hypothetical protein
MYSRKLYSAAQGATANGIATLTVPTRGKVVAIEWSVSVNSITDNSEVVLELSKASATEINVNGAQQSISEFRTFVNFVTSGLALAPLGAWHPLDVPVEQGQLLYLHTVIAGTLSVSGGCILWLI